MSATPTSEYLQNKWDSFSSIFEQLIERSTLQLSCTMLSLLGPKFIDDNDLIVEVGCGGGGSSKICAELLHSNGKGIFKVFDLSPEMINITNNKLSSYDFASATVASAESLPLDDSSVSLYYSNLTLQLVTNPEKMMQEAYRVTKPGAKLMFSIWGNRNKSPMMTIIGKVFKELGISSNEPSYRSNFHMGGNRDGLRKQFLDIGFSSCQIWSQKMVCTVTSGKEYFQLQSQLPVLKSVLNEQSDIVCKELENKIIKYAQDVFDSGKPLCLDAEMIFLLK